jgi:DNA invertase Pin-like site-specific DNA recombinase
VSAEKAVQRIHLAVEGREKAAQARRRATEELAQAVREAQKEGVAVTQIASEAGLSRQAVYDLLGERPSP